MDGVLSCQFDSSSVSLFGTVPVTWVWCFCCCCLLLLRLSFSYISSSSLWNFTLKPQLTECCYAFVYDDKWKSNWRTPLKPPLDLGFIGRFLFICDSYTRTHLQPNSILSFDRFQSESSHVNCTFFGIRFQQKHILFHCGFQELLFSVAPSSPHRCVVEDRQQLEYDWTEYLLKSWTGVRRTDFQFAETFNR